MTFHRWKKQFGQMEVNEARLLKELERENTELKKMLTEEMLKNRVLSYVCEKSCEPGSAPGISKRCGGSNAVLATAGVSVSEAGALDVRLPWASRDLGRRTVKEAAAGTIGGSPRCSAGKAGAWASDTSNGCAVLKACGCRQPNASSCGAGFRPVYRRRQRIGTMFGRGTSLRMRQCVAAP